MVEGAAGTSYGAEGGRERWISDFELEQAHVHSLGSLYDDFRIEGASRQTEWGAKGGRAGRSGSCLKPLRSTDRQTDRLFFPRGAVGQSFSFAHVLFLSPYFLSSFYSSFVFLIFFFFRFPLIVGTRDACRQTDRQKNPPNKKNPRSDRNHRCAR